MSTMENTDPPKKGKPKKVKALKIIKVGDPYYYFFIFTEEEYASEGLLEIHLDYDFSSGEPAIPVVLDYLSHTLVLNSDQKIENITPHCIKAEMPREVRLGAADYPFKVTLLYEDPDENTVATVAYDIIIFKTELVMA